MSKYIDRSRGWVEFPSNLRLLLTLPGGAKLPAAFPFAFQVDWIKYDP